MHSRGHDLGHGRIPVSHEVDVAGGDKAQEPAAHAAGVGYANCAERARVLQRKRSERLSLRSCMILDMRMRAGLHGVVGCM